MKTADFLVEIGTEEMPPKALRALMDAFRDNLAKGVDEARLAHGDVHAYASPRRLAVRIDRLALAQEDRTSEQKGPPVRVAFDDDGKPKPAAEAFAKKCGVAVEDLERVATDKGEWLVCNVTEKGRAADELLPELVEAALAALPIPRRMRWGAGEAEFVRPVHWVLMLHGERVVDGEIMGHRAGNTTRGHRFHANREITVARPDAYLAALETEGRVIADFDRRRALVVDGVAKAAAAAKGSVVDGESLYDEVAALVEWPVPLTGRFDEAFLELPREVVTSTLTGHQRYFPVAGKNGALLPAFVTVANLESRDPDQVRDGNERVILPRLADAAFFWDHDRKRTLAEREADLGDVVYQQGLGSLRDKAARTADLAAAFADELGLPSEPVRRAAMLAKCDLLTGMVGEFPELQGTMGRYYAKADGEPESVATAIGEHYQPRFAGDDIPATDAGRLLAVADKLDTIAGVFALGKKPSGNRDPFALRRAALGIVRTLVEGGIDIDLKAAIARAADAQPVEGAPADALAAEIYGFIVERLRNYFLDHDAKLGAETFDAVLAREPASLVDFARRLDAVQSFVKLDEAASLAAANKRIANILRKSAESGEAIAVLNVALFDEPAEGALAKATASAVTAVSPLLEGREYTEAMRQLAGLRDPVDRFFDDVLVMAEDDALRANRLALLADVRDLFLRVADVSRLAID